MKRLILFAALVPAAWLAASLVAAAHGPAMDARDPLAGVHGGSNSSSEQERIDLGFEIAPVPLDMQGRNPRLVGLGSYMVNAVGACLDCHTNPPFLPGGDPYMGQPKQINTEHYLAGGVAFGPFVSRNLTPQANGLPAGRTLDEFLEIMQTGVNLDCNPGDPPPFCPLLQVMPWPNHQNMTDHELRAIYEYLSVIPPAEPGVTPPVGRGG